MLQPLSFIKRVWNYEFQDFRLILEQSDELHYFLVWAKAQLFITRAILITVLTLMCILLGLSFHSCVTVWRYNALELSKAETEKKRQQALSAIASLSDSGALLDEGITETELLGVTNRYRERLQKLELLVNYSTQELKLASRALEEGLKVSGITPSMIKKLKKDNANTNTKLAVNIESIKSAGVNTEVLVNYKKNLDELQKLKNVLLIFPSRKPANNAISTSQYGVRVHPITNRKIKHEGIDFMPTIDFNAKAVINGVVEKVQHSSIGYGNMVVILHPNNVRTLYAHLDSIFVEHGQKVQAGQSIGKIGNTGFSTGRHLHYEVSVDGVKVNPSIITAMAKNVQ
ncbi:MAG: M23 family metallopeptidase [Methylophilaceae bacterium]|nr:MAG: M23 family metallopeptidase [Methylophilaceae bacterium]